MKWANENAFDDIINAEASSYGVDPSLVKAVIAQESSFQPGATHQDANGHFSAGLMQVTDQTYQALDYAGDVGRAADLSGYWSPPISIHYGVRLLAGLLNQLGNIPDAISAYNGGVRPELGFGRTAQAPVRVCLQRNPDGSCARYHDVVPGEYGNNDYVVRVLSNLTYFRQQAGQMSGGGGPLVPGASITFTPSLLTIGLVIALLWYILSPKGSSR
jgi:soluble lytic murein transglycosylase-like protein